MANIRESLIKIIESAQKIPGFDLISYLQAIEKATKPTIVSSNEKTIMELNEKLQVVLKEKEDQKSRIKFLENDVKELEELHRERTKQLQGGNIKKEYVFDLRSPHDITLVENKKEKRSG